MSGTWRARLMRGLGLVGAIGLLVAACTADVGQAGAPSTQPAEPSGSPTRTPTPTPTPTPIDVAGVFAREIAGVVSVEATISGTVVTGGVTATMRGEQRGCESGTQMHTTLSAGGQVLSETETVTVGSTTYQRDGEGLWLIVQPAQAAQAAQPAPSGSSAGGDAQRQSAVDAALAAGSFEVVGTETRGNAKLYRLASTAEIEVRPADLGLTDPTISDFTGEIAFLATADGSPAGFVASGEWVQGPADARSDVAFDMRQDYTRVNKPCEVEAPTDAWAVYTSAELGYQAAYPVPWDVTHVPADGEVYAFDAYLGPRDGEVDVYLYDDTGGATPNLWFRESAAILAEEFGVQPTVATELTLPSGARVRVLELNYTEDGIEYFFQEAVIYDGDRAWDLDWLSEAGTEPLARTMLLGFVKSFEPSED